MVSIRKLFGAKKEKPANHLFNLLKSSKRYSHVESVAIIEEVRKNPPSAATECSFEDSSENVRLEKYTCFPLFRAVKLGASIGVIEAIYNTYPPAIEGKCKGGISHGATALHLAFLQKAPAEVASFILRKFSSAAQEIDNRGALPLHYACWKDAPLEVVSLLLACCRPEDVLEIDRTGCTPLFLAFQHASKEVMSLLLDHCPQAARERDGLGRTPLHWEIGANVFGQRQERVFLVLEKCPEAVKAEDVDGETPLGFSIRWCESFCDMDESNLENSNERKKYSNERKRAETTKKILSYVDRLCGDSLNNELSKEMMAFFIEIQWWNGVLLLLDHYPPIKKQMDIKISVFPHFLCAVGQHCKMKTMWQVISNELDVMEGI